MRHAILGAGGVGGVLGACLAHAGEQVTMVVRANALQQFPAELRLESPLLGSFAAPVEKAAQVPPVDVLWLAVKATQLEDALRSVPDPLAANIVVPLLNGIDHVARLREIFAHDRVVAGTIAGEMERVAPGRFVHPSPFLMLNVAGRGRATLGATFEKLLALKLSGRFVDDEKTLLWNKLVFLGPFALATSAFGVPIGGVLSNDEWHKKLEACVREFCAVAVAEGGDVHVDKVWAAFFNVPKDMKSSMQKDVERGNQPEIEAIGGPVLRGGEKHRIPTPVARSLIAEIEGRMRVDAGGVVTKSNLGRAER
jgi:2-dehydropantoate 2-reductase